AIETASVEYTGAELIDADIELINGNFTATGNVIFNQSLTVQSGSVTVSGDATFTQSALIGNSGTSFLIIGGQLTVPNNALVVDGITLSLAQDHTFASIHIKNGGVLTTPVATETFKNGIAIEATTIIVDEGSRIDVSAKGLVGESGTGIYTGGSYGGRGGDRGSASSGSTYGEYQTPDDAGYGGRNSDVNGTGSVRGGGAIKLTAEELTLDGSILANGANVETSNNHGAGAGGSVWLNVGALVSTGGTGEIRANGGNARNGYAGGGGGGGRIAIYYEVLSFDQNNITVSGGLRGWTSADHGEAGTIYWEAKEAAPFIYNINLPAYSPDVVASLELEFSIPMDASTLSVADVTVVDAQQQAFSPTSLTALSDKRFQATFASPLGEGRYTLTVGPDVVAQNGLPMDQNRNGTGGEPEDAYTFTFVVDLSNPAAVSVDVPVAPVVNKATSTAYVLSGNREAETAILVN